MKTQKGNLLGHLGIYEWGHFNVRHHIEIILDMMEIGKGRTISRISSLWYGSDLIWTSSIAIRRNYARRTPAADSIKKIEGKTKPTELKEKG